MKDFLRNLTHLSPAAQILLTTPDYTRNLSLQSQICCLALEADECKAEIFPENQ